MTPRERIRAVLARQPVDRIPVDIWHTEEVERMLCAHFGVDDALPMYARLGVDKIISLAPSYPTRSAEDAEIAGARRTTWGALLRPVQAGRATYYERVAAPLAGYDEIAALDDYPYWPDPDAYRYDEMAARVREASQHYVVMGPWVSLFELYCEMRGLETALTDLVRRPAYVDAALDRIEQIQTDMMQRLFAQAGAHIDMALLSDDMASQENLLMSPRLWDRFFRDRLRRWCDLAHAHGLKAFYHTDGAAGALIPRLIDAGIDVLNPIQHACAGMELAELKRKYGERLVFHGAIDNQRVLPFGSPAEVAEETRRCLRTLGGGGGYIACSCHNVQAGTPLENILTMVATAHEEGARVCGE